MSRAFPNDKARFAAIDYVNNLISAPNGSRITSTEKNVLRSLAQFFNATLGFAFPSMRQLAQRCSISVRHCRRTLKSLERKGLIARTYMVRQRDGSQTSNEYFFVELGAPPENAQAQKNRLQLQRVPRIRMTEAVGRKRPQEVVKLVPRPRTGSTRSPGHQRPPVESLPEAVMDFLEEDKGGTLSAFAEHTKMQSSQSENRIPIKSKDVFNDLNLAQRAWESALETVRTTSGAKEFRTHGFPDIRVAHAATGASGVLTIELRSKNPEKAMAGIQKFEQAIKIALIGFYGCSVKIVCTAE